MNNKYVVIGANYFRGYNGAGQVSALRVIGKGNDPEEIKKIVNDNYDDCGGVILVLDLEKENMVTDIPELSF
jgi:hypothetical protein